ncbi:MAG: hypothetical protein GW763_03635 [Paraglaciecola sp.]|nr:hypothetical protein [Paraglaciecola sp.]NCT47081.1 hypothetical protein [Paraglaciecola sp.]
MQRARALVGHLLFMGLICAAGGNAYGRDWTLEKTNNQVSIYTRYQTDNQLSEKYLQVRAVTTVTAKPMALMALLNDIEQAPKWIANCIDVKILASPSPTSFVVQSVFSAPWPLKNRDMITYSLSDIENDNLVITITDVGAQYPANADIVRMTQVSGEWRVQQVTAETVEISYQGSGDPAGNIPTWLANKVLVDSTYQTFINLSQIIEKDKYQ